MNCQHYRDFMFDYFETELSPTEKNDIMQHLQICESCRRQYDLTARENDILKDTNDIPEIDVNFNNKVMEIIKAGMVNGRGPSKRRFRYLPAYSKAVVAAVLLLACLYVPGILPQLQDSRIPEQTALLENSSAKSANKDKSVTDSQKQADSVLYGYKAENENESQQLSRNDADDNLDSTAGTQMVEDNIQPKAVMMLSQTVPEPSAQSGGQGNGQMGKRESSRSLESNARNNNPIDKPGLNNIPSGFIFIESKEISKDQTEYRFENPTSQQSFLANIAPAAPVAEMIAGEDQNGVNAKATLSNEISSMAASQNVSSKVMEYNGLSFQINITSTVMTQQELDRIIEEIRLGPQTSQPQP